MDRASRTLRQKHRIVGHDLQSLIQMMFTFGGKYTPAQITKTWILHKLVDGWDSGFKAAVRSKNKGYGKKESTLEVIKKLQKEIFRL